MNGGKLKELEYACAAFCRKMGIKDLEKRNLLFKLALKSYKNTPAPERHKWTLEAVIRQNL